MEAENKVNNILQEKLNLYDTILNIIGSQMLDQFRKYPQKSDLINGGKIIMKKDDYVVEGGYIHKTHNLEKELNELKNIFRIGLNDAIKESFSRMHNI